MHLIFWRSRDKYINQSVVHIQLDSQHAVVGGSAPSSFLNIIHSTFQLFLSLSLTSVSIVDQPARSGRAQRSRLASRSLSSRARMSFLRTGPLTLRTRVRFTLPMKATLTCVMPPLEPTPHIRQTNAPTLSAHLKNNTNARKKRAAKRKVRENWLPRPSSRKLKNCGISFSRERSPGRLLGAVGGRAQWERLTGFADDFLDDGVHDFTRVHVRI